MSPVRRRLVIVSPYYLPAPGGAARYYSALAAELLDKDPTLCVEIVTEAYPDQPAFQADLEGRLTIRRIFPYRAGNLGMSRWVVALYLLQQIQLLGLAVKPPGPGNAYLIHGYFHNRPGAAPLLAWLLRALRRRGGRLVADLRDPRLPRWAFRGLYPYDSILCCSQNVLDLISVDPRLDERAQLVPIPFEVERPSDEAVRAVLSRFGLAQGAYVYSPNGVQRDKNIDEILAMTEGLRRRGHRLALVVAGRRRDWGAVHEDAERRGVLRYLGLVSHHETLCLTAGSALVPVISPTVESISRAALESLAMGTPVLLPANVPEFRAGCASQVAVSLEVDELVSLAEGRLGVPNGPYDLSVHGFERTGAQTAKLLWG